MRTVKDAQGQELVQRSAEWTLARTGIPTASEFGNLVTPKFKIKTGEAPKTYLHSKLAEAWQGYPLISDKPWKVSFAAEQGQILENRAIPWFELEFNTKVDRVGLCVTDDGRVGCSPDGLIGEDGGIEIKCPFAQTHVGYLLDGELPEDYAAQVHGSLYVTGRSWWKFVSYRNQFPQLVLTIERDDKIQATIAQALADFLGAFDAGMKKLEEINGGPPPKISYPEREKLMQTDPRDEIGITP